MLSFQLLLILVGAEEGYGMVESWLLHLFSGSLGQVTYPKSSSCQMGMRMPTSLRVKGGMNEVMF